MIPPPTSAADADPAKSCGEAGPYTVICTYLPKPDKVSLLRQLLSGHWPLLHRLGFVTDEPATLYYGEDESGLFFAEIMTWADPGATGRAYWCEEVNGLWAQFYEHTECRGSRPAIEYPRVHNVALLHQALSDPPRRSALGPSPAGATWDRKYREGLHRAGWDRRTPSPELVAVVAAGLVPPHGVALDVGCGSGTDALFLAECNLQTFGLDISEDALHLAAAADPRGKVSWHLGTILAAPFADEQFDLITDRGCFHHISDSDRPQYAREVTRLLKLGGKLLLRGSAEAQFPFIPVTSTNVRALFPASDFSSSPVLPIDLFTDAGRINGNLVLLTRHALTNRPTSP